jgi:hypothetical protein
MMCSTTSSGRRFLERWPISNSPSGSYLMSYDNSDLKVPCRPLHTTRTPTEGKNPMKSRIRFCIEVMALAVATLGGQSFQRAAAQVPEENRKQVVEALGPPFIVFREKVLDELKVSDEQKEKLMQHLMEQIMETGPFLDALTETGPEREKKLNEHRKHAKEKLDKLLKEVLQPGQRNRLRQVTLQQEGGFALGQEDVRKELKISQQQMMKFMAIVQDLQKNVEALIKEAQAGGNPEEIRPKIEKLRKDHAQKLEAVLTDAQKKQWKELLGPPFELGD